MRIEQLLDWLRLIADNWWILATVGGLVLLAVLVRNAKAILHTLAVAIGIGFALVVVLTIVGTPATSTPAPIAARPPAAPVSSSSLDFLGGACIGAALLIAAAVTGAVLYRRFFGFFGGQGKWLPGPNALWGRYPSSQSALPFYVDDEGDALIAALILSNPDLWGMSAPMQVYDDQIE